MCITQKHIRAAFCYTIAKFLIFIDGTGTKPIDQKNPKSKFQNPKSTVS
jgi:hypothetical protein